MGRSCEYSNGNKSFVELNIEKKQVQKLAKPILKKLARIRARKEDS